MDNKFLTDIKNIRNAIETKKLVVFAGAGISIDAGIPSWNTLIEEMKSEINLPKNEQDYLKIAQMYFNERHQKEYVEKIRTTLKHKKIKHNEIHEEIFQLNPEHILTTNYDDLLEQVIKKQSLPYSIISKDNQFPYALNTNLLIKIHGDIDDSDFVLKEDDYIDYSITHPLIEGFIKSIFASKVVLFIGYSFSDINLKMIIQNVRTILGNDFQNAYFISVDDKFHNTQKVYLKNKGINVVSYQDANIENEENFIISYLKGANALNEKYFEEVENLSPQGFRLLNFLKFISKYDKFNEPICNKNVIDQIYFSLNRFNELTSLPQDFLAKLFPFNISKKNSLNINGYSLLTKNENLINLFFNQFNSSNEGKKFNPPQELNLTEAQINDYEKKINEIIEKLNYSLIFFIVKENKMPDSFGNHGWSNDYIILQSKNDINKDSLDFKLDQLLLSELIFDINNSNVTETTNIQLDLEIAFNHYKIGNFKTSYNLFELIANKAWQTGKYFSYYIAKHNIKTIRNLLSFYENNLNNDVKQKILRLMDDVDFDKLLFQIPYMGGAEYELLKIIRDDSVLINAEDIINETYKNILQVYELYKKGGRSMGPNYVQTIQIELSKISLFYNSNYIIIDEFNNFTKLIKKGIEALLISFATNKKYDLRLTEFNKTFFDFIISYCDAKEIIEIAQKYEIDNFTFKEEELKEILIIVDNFLKSFFVQTNVFQLQFYADKFLNNQLNNEFFNDKCIKKFKNIFLILSKIEISNDISIYLVPNLINFLKHESFLWGDCFDYLNSFLLKNRHLLSKEDIIKILDSFTNKPSVYLNTHTFQTISTIYKQNDFDGISNSNLINTLLKNSGDGVSKIIVPLWDISDDNIKSILKERILNSLNFSFSINLYLESSRNHVIDYNLYFEQYISELNATKHDGFFIENGKLNVNNFSFINSMIFIYSLNLEVNDIRLNAFTNLTDFMRFYLFPEKFDYKKFNTDWLLIAPREVFFIRFNKIPKLKKEIENALKISYNPILSEIYFKYFV